MYIISVMTASLMLMSFLKVKSSDVMGKNWHVCFIGQMSYLKRRKQINTYAHVKIYVHKKNKIKKNQYVKIYVQKKSILKHMLKYMYTQKIK